jgi:hypothetical protein
MEWIRSNIDIGLEIIGFILVFISGLHYSRRTGEYWRFFVNLGWLNFNAKERFISLIGLIFIIIGIFV